MTCVVINDFQRILDIIKERRKEDLIAGQFRDEWRQIVRDRQFPFDFPFTLVFDERHRGYRKMTVTVDGFGHHPKTNVEGLLITYTMQEPWSDVVNVMPALEHDGKNLMLQEHRDVMSLEEWRNLRVALFVTIHYICHFDTYYDRVERAERKRIAQSSGGKVRHTDFIVRLLERRESCANNRGVGTGGQKRYHLCRGHWKNHMGRRIWIKPHWKGNKELGTVHKDYKVC